MKMNKKILLYDTTLRDGTQGEQVNLSAEDKLKEVAEKTGVSFLPMDNSQNENKRFISSQ